MVKTIRKRTYRGHVLRIVVRITIMVLLLIGVRMVETVMLNLSEKLPGVPQMSGRLEANGTYFELNDNDYIISPDGWNNLQLFR